MLRRDGIWWRKLANVHNVSIPRKLANLEAACWFVFNVRSLAPQVWSQQWNIWEDDEAREIRSGDLRRVLASRYMAEAESFNSKARAKYEQLRNRRTAMDEKAKFIIQCTAKLPLQPCVACVVEIRRLCAHGSRTSSNMVRRAVIYSFTYIADMLSARRETSPSLD